MRGLRSAVVRGVLAGAAVLGIAWLVYSQTIIPLRRREGDFLRRRQEVRDQLDSARRTLREIKDAEQESAQARAALNRLVGEDGRGSLMVTFPESVKQQFARAGLPLRVIRLNTVQEEPRLGGYQRVYWSVGVPIPEADRNVSVLLHEVVKLEEPDRFIKVVDFALQPDVDDPHLRTAAINIMALVRK